MAIALEIRVRHLLPEFLADAFIFLCSLQSTGAITAGPLKALADSFDHFFIFIQAHCHTITSFVIIIQRMSR